MCCRCRSITMAIARRTSISQTGQLGSHLPAEPDQHLQLRLQRHSFGGELCGRRLFGNLFPAIPGALNSKLPPHNRFPELSGLRLQRRLGKPLVRPGSSTISSPGLRAGTRSPSEVRSAGCRTRKETKGNESGTYNFSTLNTGLRGVQSGNDFASFLLGTWTAPASTCPRWQLQYIRQKYYASYVNDSWKVTPKLTLNLGVRWDISTPTRDKYNNWSFVDPYLANPGADGQPGALVFAGHVAGTSNPGQLRQALSGKYRYAQLRAACRICVCAELQDRGARRLRYLLSAVELSRAGTRA